MDVLLANFQEHSGGTTSQSWQLMHRLSSLNHTVAPREKVIGQWHPGMESPGSAVQLAVRSAPADVVRMGGRWHGTAAGD